MAANDGEHPVSELFGVRLPNTTGAPGTAGASGDADDDTGAGRVTPPWGPSQASARYPASTSGTVMPDQVSDSPISTGPERDYSDTGAGRGSGSHYPRRPWQQSDGQAG
jgi:hypothetical protein